MTNLAGLSNDGHSGQVPSEIWMLTNLPTIVMGQNPIMKGSIPTDVGMMSKLRWLIVDNNGLTGKDTRKGTGIDTESIHHVRTTKENPFATRINSY